MKFIPQSLEAAKHWVDVCWKSMGIDRDEVASMYANMCGFGSWDLLLANMVVERPSKTDEESQDEIVKERHAYYKDVLVDTFFMNPLFADYLLKMASPSSGQPLAEFSVDKNQIFSNDSSGYHLPGITATKFAKNLLGNRLGPEFDFNEFTNQLRVHSNVFPGYWFNLVASLGWEVDPGSYIDAYELGKPSMLLRLKDETIPVYIVSLTRIPLETTDQMANKVMGMIAGDILDREYDKAILFWGSMLSRNFQGRWFTHPGMVFKNSEWKEFLINQHVASVEDVLTMVDSLDLSNPPVTLEDFQMELHRGFGCMKIDVDDPENVEFAQISNSSGWIHLLPSLKDN